MRVGILTFHRAENFGAVLQCYALQKFLEREGYDVSVIDYRCEAIERVYAIYDFKLLVHRYNLFASVRSFFMRMKYRKDKIKKKRQYKQFREVYLNLTNSLSSITQDLGFDAYIVGSDQVWNTTLTHGYIGEYLLDFPMSNNALKIAYAVSSEESAIKNINQYKKEFEKALSSFTAISVREEMFKEKLGKLFNIKINVCIDPTFLLDKSDYDRLLPPQKKRNYILVYHMAESADASKLADRLAEDSGKEVVEIHANFSKRLKQRHLQNAGPIELLEYIAYADIVITTSFHGLAFSLIMNKNFYVISKHDNQRLRNILTIVGLKSRLVNNINHINIDPINYDIVNRKLHNAVVDSKSFLLSVLKSDKNENSILGKQ